MKSQIQIHEPFKKTWSEPQIIVSRNDVIEYEKSLTANQTPRNDTEHVHKNLPQQIDTENNRDSPVSVNIVSERLDELRNSLLRSQVINQRLCTPKKCDNTDSETVTHSTIPTTPSNNSDWMIPELSRSRSLPSSPMLGPISPTQSPSRVQERSFSFVPERLRQVEGVRLSPETDEVDNGSCLSQRRYNDPHGMTEYPQDCYMERIMSLQEKILSACPPDRPRTSPFIQTQNQPVETTPIRAKRKLDMDDPYSTSAKRTKTELAREAGMRYVNQLEMDLMSLKQRLHYASPEVINKPTNCACAEMEKHFMEMAMSAYKSIRRYDGSANSFERFKQELTQTNQVIKDSMELLQNVRRLCVH